MNEKNGIAIDNEHLKTLYSDKLELVKDLKDKALYLGAVYGDCIKIEIDVNPKMKSVKLSVREYL